jgi:hypothetical protein
MPPVIYAIYIINKSGGLVFNKVCVCVGGDEKGGGRRVAGNASLSLLPSPPPLPFQEFAPMASLDVNDTLRFASVW